MKNANNSKTISQRLSRLVMAVAFVGLACFLSPDAKAVTFTVTNTNNSGAGSLRQAMLDSNANPGVDFIFFNIAGVGVKTISPSSALPAIIEKVFINGFSQPGTSQNTLAVGNNSVLLIELNGANAGAGANGLKIQADGCEIAGLVINRFSGSGILVNSAGNTIRGNYIGTNPAGAVALGNEVGIILSGAPAHNNLIGSGTYATRNVISGNTNIGVYISGGATANQLRFNYIGTDASGTVALGNTGPGIEIVGSPNNTIGSLNANDRNVISGNANTVPNSGFKYAGISIGTSPGTKVQGNYIGTDATGTAKLPNDHGVRLLGASNNQIGVPSGGNLISGNNSNGVFIESGTSNTIHANKIGTNAMGTAALGNGLSGISIIGGADSTSTQIGAGSTSNRNIISGNGRHGIEISSGSDSTIIQNNYIGTSAMGDADLGNKFDGISIFGCKFSVIGGPGAGNIIAGHGRYGMRLTYVEKTKIESNLIGVQVNGSSPLGNANTGILLADSNDNSIGGPGVGNTIAFNGDGAIWLTGTNTSTNNLISANSIFSNNGLGIESGAKDGLPLPNDADDVDTGVNGLNYPTITSAVDGGGTTNIGGVLNSQPNKTYKVELFASPECDLTGHGEGKTLLHSFSVASGVVWDVSMLGSLAGQFITATATDSANNTSEFSQCKAVSPPGALQFSEASYSANENSGNKTITVVRTGGYGGYVSANIAISDVTAKAGDDYTTGITSVVFAHGETSKTISVTVQDDSVYEGDETLALSLGDLTGGATLGNPKSATLTIVDNEQKPSVSISDVSVTEGNSASTDASFTVTLSGASAQSVSVLFSTADVSAQGGSDYDPVSGTLTFAPGEVSKSVLVPVKGDTDVEPDQTFQVNLSNVIGNTATVADGQGMATIINDDSVAQPSLEFDSLSYSVNEGAGRLDAIVVRSGDSSVPVTITFTTDDGNAKQKSDFNIALGALKFASGETSKTVSIFITDDAYVEGGETFTLSLSSPQGAAVGANSSAIVSIVDNDAAQSANNPADNTAFFLRQHYVDFLNREPEAAGFQGWTDILSNCGAGDSKCDRIEVSSAFFRSQEFQIRGYFAYRFYEASLGRNPSYLEFMADLRRVTGYLSDQQLEEAKVDLVKDFMARQEFKDKYDGIQDAGAYVDALAATAGVTLANRDALVLALQNGQKTRAEILRMVAESQEVGSKYYNKAFVVMQYFGYLRRDPDILYLNWIDTLNQTGDYRTMVNGFLNSLEYRERFNQ